MSITLKMGAGNPHAILVGNLAPLFPFLSGLFPKGAKGDFHAHGGVTFGFDNHKGLDHSLRQGEYPMAGCYVENSWFDLVAVSFAGTGVERGFEYLWDDVVSLGRWGSLFVVYLTREQFALQSGVCALRFEDPAALPLGEGVVVVGSKKEARSLDRRARAEMEASVAGGLFEYLSRTVVADGCHGDALPPRWHSANIDPEALAEAVLDDDPLALFGDRAVKVGLSRPPITPSLAGIAKYISSGQCGDVTVGPLGEVIYIEGYAKKVKRVSKMVEDGVEVTVTVSEPRTEAWGLVLETAPGSKLETGDYVYTRY